MGSPLPKVPQTQGLSPVVPQDKPAKIAKYDIIDVIGRGGMGVVYKAIDPYLNRLVAIKMMTGGYSEKPELLKRFFREAQSAGSLQHPNIVTIFELGDHGGTPYLVMEYLEGESLDSIIKSRRQLSLLEKISMIIEVCRGLSCAHRRGIVHRDVKPANIMVSKHGAIKIVDFGIAHVAGNKVTGTGKILGSLSYMSPEQINGKSVDARSDVFSTGVVLYQLCTNTLPFDGDTTAATLLKIVNDPPPPLRNFLTVYPPELEAIILHALAKNREQRFPSADDFALDLGQLHGQLKHDIITRRMQEASLLLERAELHSAKDQLLEVLKIDHQHTGATFLLRDVQQRIQKDEISEQVWRLRLEAQDAYEQEQFEAALNRLDAALRLDRDNRDLQRLRDSARAGHERAQKLAGALRLAEVAHQQDDLDSAKQAVEEALEMAPNDTQAKALYRAIQRDWVERSRQKQVESLLGTPREEIALPTVTASIDIVKQERGSSTMREVERTTVPSGDISGWPEQTLRTVERQLATFMGPIAGTVVKRAAARTTDMRELYQVLATKLERETDRTAFLAATLELRHGSENSQPPRKTLEIGNAAASASVGSETELTPAAIEHAAAILARYVGPLSGVLTKRAARRAAPMACAPSTCFLPNMWRTPPNALAFCGRAAFQISINNDLAISRSEFPHQHASRVPVPGLIAKE
jgi:serine/threonine protein kinase